MSINLNWSLLGSLSDLKGHRQKNVLLLYLGEHEKNTDRPFTVISGVASPTIYSRYAKFQVIIIIHFFTN